MLTAAITAGIAFILSVFGVKPGPYLVAVAVVVKLIIVAIGLTFGARWMLKRKAKAEAALPPPGPPPSSV